MMLMLRVFWGGYAVSHDQVLRHQSLRTRMRVVGDPSAVESRNNFGGRFET